MITGLLLTNFFIEIKFLLLLPKDYYLIPSKGTKNLLTKIDMYAHNKAGFVNDFGKNLVWS